MWGFPGGPVTQQEKPSPAYVRLHAEVSPIDVYIERCDQHPDVFNAHAVGGHLAWHHSTPLGAAFDILRQVAAQLAINAAAKGKTGVLLTTVEYKKPPPHDEEEYGEEAWKRVWYSSAR